MRNLLKKTGKWIFPAIATLLTFIFLKCVFLIGYVPSESMEPTLERGSYIIGCRIYSSLETGDIIIFRHDGKLLVKRIVAVGGDNADSSYDSRYWLDPFVDGADVVAKLIS